MGRTAVINPYSGKIPDSGPAFAVMAATLPDVKDLALSLCGSRDSFRDFFSSRLYQGDAGGLGFYIAGPFIGAPHAAILLENLIARGVRRVLFAGWCGSLSDSVSIGDLFIASGAWPDEGTSLHYGVEDKGILLETSADMNEDLAQAMDALDLPLRTGTVWTTDALYRETPEKINEFRNKKAVAVEMELSAILAVSAFRGVDLSSLLLVSDSVATLEWQPGFKNPDFKKGRKNLTSVVCKFLESF
jgi:purine-nucleoside phosphorylase